MDFKYRPEPDVMGYIDRETLLGKYGEEAIFSLVFGKLPKPYRYITSPFREDRAAGCYFHISPSGRLRFVDFGNTSTPYGINMTNIDCFDAVQVYFKLSNFYLVLRFIEERLKDGRRTKKIPRKPVQGRVGVSFLGRNFVETDAKYWSSYGISKSNLLEDGVFPVSRIMMKNTVSGDQDYLLRETCYAYTGFDDRMKFYFPFRTGRKRFVSTCTSNDVGSVGSLPPYGRQLIYTKSYKDRRVLANSGRNVVWNQNEGMEPEDSVLFPLVKRFDKVVVLYDNDGTGMESSLKLAERINAQFPHRARPLWIPEGYLAKGIKDPSDLIKASKREYEEFLYNSLI